MAKNSSGESTSTKATKSRTMKTASQSRLKVVATGATGRGTEPSPAELNQEIRLRAYQFFCERGGQHGAHEDDWHRAEQEVREKYREKYSYGT